MSQWLGERSVGEIICLILTVGMALSAVLAALRGKGA